jgi:hypothetical protein
MGSESYEWWPKYRPTSWGTITCVEGELNGQTSFGGTPTTDPHHFHTGDEQHTPYINFRGILLHGKYKGKSCICMGMDNSEIVDAIKDCIREFARDYSRNHGNWCWPIGPNCRSFIQEMMYHCCMRPYFWR